MKAYDYLVVGAGLYGAVFASELKAAGKEVLVIDKRAHIGGNIYTEEIDGINVHVYGAHIFHTSNKDTWEYINRFAEFNNYINSPIAKYKNELYNLPFNMNTFSKLWGISTPDEALAIIGEQIEREGIGEPKNLEEQALSLVGRDVYEKLVKGYTEKQWGRDCKDLPAFIIKRLPIRLTFDNNYFNDRYQGIPIGGYTAIIEKLLTGIDVAVDCDYIAMRHAGAITENRTDASAPFGSASIPHIGNITFDKLVFTGPIDAYYEEELGTLEYRSLRFETERLNTPNYQGNAVVNYTEREIPYTRIIEHKHFEFGKQDTTVISREYPSEWKRGDEPYYPVNDEKNTAIYKKYEQRAASEANVTFGGRLGVYKYYDMDKVVEEARKAAEIIKKI